MIATDIKDRIFEYLKLNCFCRLQAVRAGELAKHFEVSLRDINSVIRDLRREGQMIGSSKQPPFGYYIPKNEKEVREYLCSFLSELQDMLTTYHLQKKAQKSFLESLKQTDLFQSAGGGQLEIIDLGRRLDNAVLGN